MKALLSKEILVHAPHQAINHIARSQTRRKIIRWKEPGFVLTEFQQLVFNGLAVSVFPHSRSRRNRWEKLRFVSAVYTSQAFSTMVS